MSQNVHGAPAPVWGLSIGCLGTAVVLGTCCILTLLAVGTSPGSLVIGGLLAVVVAPFYAGFLLWLDPLEHEPPWLLAIAALWGAGVATFVGALSTAILEGMSTVALGLDATAADALGSVLFAPVTEEIAKGAFLLFLFVMARHELDDVIDGIVYGGLVGLGFAVVEDFGYYLISLAEGGVTATGILFILRGVLTGFGHSFFTALTGLGFGVARTVSSGPLRVLAIAGGLTAGIAFHALWNALAVATAMTGSVALVVVMLVGYPFGILLPGAVGLAVVAIVHARSRRRAVKAALRHAVEEGLARPEDLETLTSPWRRRARQLRLLYRYGWRAFWVRRRLDIALADWAYRQWHRSRGDRLPRFLSAFEAEALEARIRRWQHELDRLLVAPAG